MKKKTGAVTASDAMHLAAVESQRFSALQSIISHCAVRRYDDGDPREPGWVTVRTQGSAWVVQVKDPDTGCSFAAHGPTLDDALALACLLLESDDAPWERDQWLQNAKKKKK